MQVAFDIGGTFTDVVLAFDDGHLGVAKLLSVHDELGPEIGNLIRRHDLADSVDGFVHATTVCSNALIERQLPRVAFITTTGFGATLELMGQRGPSSPDLDWQRPDALVPKELSFEVEERLLADGTVFRPLSSASVQECVRAVAATGVEAIAISLINAHVDGVHERAIRDELHQQLPGVPVCISSEIDPQIREYERASTTVINALLVPVVNGYLDELQDHLDTFSPRLRIMQSNGGTMDSRVARQRPMSMVESGPAAGVLAAARVAEELAIAHTLSFDMGGTTAKACLIENGAPLERSGMEVGGDVGAVKLRGHGHPLRAPSLDIVEVGAGGGSIAWIDSADVLRVGPRSAGADPGPVCYQNGGSEPTVTDANVALGYISPDAIADDTLRLDRDAALEAIDRRIATPLGLDVLDAALGIIDVANATMLRALRAVSTERGRDIRSTTLLAFGGSGPVHAASLCDLVGISRALIPPMPGVFSALGLLLANERLDYVHSFELPLDELSADEVHAAYGAMLDSAEEDARASGQSSAERSVALSLELRYRHEPRELRLPLDIPPQLDHKTIARDFRRSHAQEFGSAGEGEIHVASMRLRFGASHDRLSLDALTLNDDRAQRERPLTRRVAAFRGLGEVDVPVVGRSAIAGVVDGPLVVQETTSTVVVPPGWRCRVDHLSNLLLERGESEA